jgi:hypothetical protein
MNGNTRYKSRAVAHRPVEQTRGQSLVRPRPPHTVLHLYFAVRCQ